MPERLVSAAGPGRSDAATIARSPPGAIDSVAALSMQSVENTAQRSLSVNLFSPESWYWLYDIPHLRLALLFIGHRPENGCGSAFGRPIL